MSIATILLLLSTGFAGGIITTIVGGSSLICFPAMMAAGLPPVVASASNTIAVTPGSIVGAFSDKGYAPRWTPHLAVLAGVSVIGGAIGALLLVALPETTFTALVPAMIGGATLLFAMGDQVRRWIGRRTASGRSTRKAFLEPFLFAPLAVYGGYFGAGLGVMMLAVFAVGGEDDYRTMNALKNLLGTLTNVVAIGIYIFFDLIAWPATLAMMSGAVCGGFAGGRLMRFLPPKAIRAVVVGVGTIMTVVYAGRYWAG